MTDKTINMKAKRLMELEAQNKELEAQIDKIKSEIQAQMGNSEELTTNKYQIKWTFFSKVQFDTKGFKVAHPDLYNIFAKDKEQRRFSVTEIA